MKEFFESLEKNFTILVMIVITSIFSMIVYALKSKEEPKDRVKNTFAGGIIACILAYPTWLFVRGYLPELSVYWLVPITFVYTITGQFLPEFLQEYTPKIITKTLGVFYKKKTGEDLDK